MGLSPALVKSTHHPGDQQWETGPDGRASPISTKRADNRRMTFGGLKQEKRTSKNSLCLSGLESTLIEEKLKKILEGFLPSRSSHDHVSA